jgi:hypothetical protein
MKTMNKDTPESNKAKIAFTSLFANDDAYWIPYTVGTKLERERNEAREDLKFKEKLCAELTKQLRKEQQLHVQTLNERDEARKIAAELREALQFVATDKIANAADMRCRAARALEFCPENEKSPCAGATKMKS